jgi:hypothetical protein
MKDKKSQYQVTSSQYTGVALEARLKREEAGLQFLHSFIVQAA